MATELIVLSSDDEEVVPAEVARPRKRIKHSSADHDVLVLQNTSHFGSSKSPQDEDCLIIDYDPENHDWLPQFQACEADDLVVVAEHGQVACRDFPHSRHTCVKFPFSSSSHEKHCQQCFCYVCDIPAPCKHWGTGKHSMDHCHAVDNSEVWKRMRSQLRCGSRNRAASSLGRVSRRQMTQLQTRAYTQPPIRVTLTGGISSPSNHTNMNTNVPLANQQGRCLPGNIPPYFPSSMNLGLVNGPHRHRPTPGPVNTSRIGQYHSYSNMVHPPATNRRRRFSEHRDTVPFTASTTAKQQTMSYQPASNPVPLYDPFRMALTAGMPALNPVTNDNLIRMAPPNTPRQGAMHKHPPPRAAAHVSFLNASGQVCQEPGVVGSPVAPSNFVGSLNTTTQRVTGFGKDFREGITGQSHVQSTPLGMGKAEPAGFQGQAHCSEGSAQIPFKIDTESLYDPLEPCEMPPCNNIMAGSMPSLAANTLASAELGNVPPQLPDTQGSLQVGTNNEIILDSVAAKRMTAGLTPWWSNESVGECDEDFWMLFDEATLP